MAKPASLPRWSETVAGVPGANEVEPTEGKKDVGYGTGGDIPTSGGLNWWMRLVYLWVKWVDTAASLATASALVVRDAAGRARFADPVDVADADTLGARDAAITTHNAVTNPHSATALATASRMVLRDAAGRAAFADPAADADAATQGWARVDALKNRNNRAAFWNGLLLNGSRGWQSLGTLLPYRQNADGEVVLAGVAATNQTLTLPIVVADALPIGSRPLADRFFRLIDTTDVAAVSIPGKVGADGNISLLSVPAVNHAYSFDGVRFMAEQ
jgi:hypothetical protein